MNCATCISLFPAQRRLIEIGQRVTVSRWEQVWLGMDLVGTVVQLGHSQTRRAGTAKVLWDNGYKNQWWPIASLVPVNP